MHTCTIAGWLSLVFGLLACAAPSPAAHWRGDNDATDAVGTNHGTLVNGTTFASGIATGGEGQAFQFDGVDDKIRIPDPLDFEFANQLTVAGWMQTAGTADFSGLVDSFFEGEAVAGFQVSMSGTSPFPPNQPGILRADLGVGSGYVTVYNLTPVDDGAAHHFALTYDGQQAILYVDGLAGLSVATSNWEANHSADLLLGQDSASASRHFRGELDEMMVFNTALDLVEVRALAGIPTLQLVKSAPGSAMLSWPDNVSGFHLQMNDTVDPAGWLDASTGTNNPVTIPTAPSARFFRLVKP